MSEARASRRSLGTAGLATLLMAAAAVLAIAAIAVYDQLESHGLNDKQINQITAKCEERAEARSTGERDQYDEILERCEEVEKTYLNPDPLPPG